jgi:hypothetical protein
VEAKSYTDTIDLSSEYEIKGTITNYKWFDISDGTEKEIEQPENENGVFSFTEVHKNKRLRCKMTNDAFPGSMFYLDNDLWNVYMVLVYETDIVSSIEETQITNLLIAPNPTSSFVSLSFDLETAGVLKIELIDLLGSKLLEIHNDFEQEGTFSKEFSLETLPTGAYFIKINHNGSIKMEKVIRE